MGGWGQTRTRWTLWTLWTGVDAVDGFDGREKHEGQRMIPLAFFVGVTLEFPECWPCCSSSMDGVDGVDGPPALWV